MSPGLKTHPYTSFPWVLGFCKKVRAGKAMCFTKGLVRLDR